MIHEETNWEGSHEYKLLCSGNQTRINPHSALKSGKFWPPNKLMKIFVLDLGNGIFISRG